MPPRVLVTRPKAQCGPTARRLREMGVVPVILPLSEIAPLPPPRPPDASFDAVVVTSANALRHAPAALVATLAPLPCISVGARTARAAREAGFADVSAAGGDVDALVETLRARFPQGSVLAYLCGRVRRSTLEDRLSASGLSVVALETYDTLEVSHTTESFANEIGSRPVDFALFFSGIAAGAFGRLRLQEGAAHLLENTTAICLSARVSAVLRESGMRDIAVSARPTEAAMLDALRRFL